VGHRDAADVVAERALGDVWIDVRRFSSGALTLTIRQGGHTIMVDARPPREWAMSVDPAEGEGFTGHDHEASSLEELLTLIRQELAAE
jgi:hypothetical protein